MASGLLTKDPSFFLESRKINRPPGFAPLYSSSYFVLFKSYAGHGQAKRESSFAQRLGRLVATDDRDAILARANEAQPALRGVKDIIKSKN